MTKPEALQWRGNDDWLLTLYTETWKQYVHEDTIAQTRGTIFTAIFAALVAALGALSIQIVLIPCSLFLNTYIFAPGIIALGVVLLISASYVLKPLIVAFNDVTRAGHRYLNARGASLRVLEATAKLGPFGPATFEDIWRDLSDGKNPDINISVLSGELQKVSTITTYNFKGGFSFLFQIINVLFRIAAFLRFAGIVFFLIGVLFPFIPVLKTVPLCK